MKRACLVAAATAAALSGVSAGAASPSIPELVEVADLGSLSLSPDGNYLLFRTERADLSRNSYDLAWHSYDVRTGENEFDRAIKLETYLVTVEHGEVRVDL